MALTESGRDFLPKIEVCVEANKKRGPDNQQTFYNNNIALGHSRLSVIDLNQEANQPFSDGSGRYHIVFNGEIYNFQTLRVDLEMRGYIFRTKSDTEVLLNLFIEEGAEALNKLNGFFAFAVYDSIEEQLFLARDRYGIKPLIYYKNDDVFIFSSRMQGIKDCGIQTTLDSESIYHYFQLNYIPQPYSIYNEIKKIPAGHYCRIDKHNFLLTRYYDLKPVALKTAIPTYNEAKKNILQLLTKSVERRLITDVPLGAFLSGGLDSSIIVALAAQLKPDLETFSVGFSDQPHYDERRFAAAVAKKYNTRHHEIVLKSSDLFNVLFDVLDEIDEPFADSSALAVYSLSKEVKKHVTVALSGDGADELFGGYIKHSAEWMALKYNWLSSSMRLLLPFLKLLPQSRNSSSANIFRQLNRMAEGIGLSEADRYWRWCSISTAEEVKSLLQINYSTQISNSRKAGNLRFMKGKRDLNNVLLSDQELVLPGDMLHKVDSMSMAHALEVRVPFLDHNLVSYVNLLPADYKIQWRMRKRILRDTFASFLPEEVKNRGKHGFEVPLLNWFRGEFGDYIRDNLLEAVFIKRQGIFRIEAITELQKKLHSSNPGDIASKLWALIVFQYWWKKHHQ